jgi:hypothetical protein
MAAIWLQSMKTLIKIGDELPLEAWPSECVVWFGSYFERRVHTTISYILNIDYGIITVIISVTMSLYQTNGKTGSA